MEIKLINLVKKFKENIAIDDITLTIPSGKLIGFLGPSGCGKSTTLYMIAGLLEPTSGQICFGEKDVTNLKPEKRGIGFVFQNYALYPHMTVLQNIMFPLENTKTPRAEAKSRAEEVAKLVQIDALLDRKPAQLSGGQQQRVAIARALVKKPSVLLLDEPLSNLDARLRIQTREEIKRIQRETGITTIFVTHDQEEALSICDEIVLINEGKIKQQSDPQQVYKSPENIFVAKFLGNPSINIVTGTVKNKNVYLGDVLLNSVETNDTTCSVGIRPEDFRIDPNGLEIKIHNLELVGRDTLVKFSFINQEDILVAVVDSDLIPADKTSLKISIKKKKVHFFNSSTGDILKTTGDAV